MIELYRQGQVFVLHMDAGENRFNGDSLDGIEAALDEAEAFDGPAALVTTGEGKFFSNGLDLEWMMSEGTDRAEAFVGRVHAMFARVLAVPMASVAAINGHAFAGGAMLSLSHDFRVMREDRGYFCLPEIDLGIPFTPAMTALLQARLPKQTFHEAAVSGRRYTAEQALQRGIVDTTAPQADVLDRAIAMAAELTEKDHKTMGAIKEGLYRDALAVLRNG